MEITEKNCPRTFAAIKPFKFYSCGGICEVTALCAKLEAELKECKEKMVHMVYRDDTPFCQFVDES